MRLSIFTVKFWVDLISPPNTPPPPTAQERLTQAIRTREAAVAAARQACVRSEAILRDTTHKRLIAEQDRDRLAQRGADTSAKDLEVTEWAGDCARAKSDHDHNQEMAHGLQRELDAAKREAAAAGIRLEVARAETSSTRVDLAAAQQDVRHEVLTEESKVEIQRELDGTATKDKMREYGVG